MLTIVAIDHDPEHPVEEIAGIKWVTGADGLLKPHRITIHDDKKETDVAMIVSEREYHMIWAALRHWQNSVIEDVEYPPGLLDVATNGGEVRPITSSEIGDLLEERNLGAIQPLNLDRMAWDKIRDENTKSIVKTLIAAGHFGAAVSHLYFVHSFEKESDRAACDWAASEMEKEKGDGD